MTVGVMTYFIGDLLGYWPGLEDKLKHEIVYPNTDATERCEQLELSPNRIDFSELGQARELKIAINGDCGETVYCSSENESVATVSVEARTSTEADMKYVVFTINAASPGETSIVVSCGKKKAYCTVMCDFEMPTTTEEQPGSAAERLQARAELFQGHHPDRRGRAEAARGHQSGGRLLGQLVDE